MKSELPELPLIHGALFIDNSGWMEGLQACLRLVEYRQLHGRISSGESPALSFGTAIHTALEYRYVKYGNQPVDESYYSDVAEMLTEHFTEHETPDGDWRTLNWAMDIIRKYNEKYQREQFNLLKYDHPFPCPICVDKPENNNCKWCSGSKLRTMMVEMSFALPLFVYTFSEDQHSMLLARDYNGPFTIPIVYTGKIDLPVMMDGDVYITDHKSSGMLGQQFWDRQRMSAQQRGYCWAFQELTGKTVKGFQVNGIRTKEPPQYVTSDAPSGNKKYSKTSWWDESLARQRFYLKDTDLVEWKRNTIAMVEEFFFHYANGYLPKRTESCVRFGKCPFYDICILEPEDRGAYLYSGEYTKNYWTPLKNARLEETGVKIV